MWLPPVLDALAGRLDWLLGRLLALAGWLALPVVACLFAQWPLRDLVQAYSREANDAAQWMFALYVACAVTAATRADAHLAAPGLAAFATAAGARRRRLAAILVGLLPWSLFVMVACGPATWRSILQFEHFPDTFNPFYFMIRFAAFLMAALILAQALVDLARLARGAARRTPP